jgi:hypothetical protein
VKNAVIAVMLSQKPQNPCAARVLAMTEKLKCCHDLCWLGFDRWLKPNMGEWGDRIIGL